MGSCCFRVHSLFTLAQLQNKIKFAGPQPYLKCCQIFSSTQSLEFTSDSGSWMNKDSTEYIQFYIEFFPLNLKRC